MGTRRHWIRLIAVAAAYAVAFVCFRRFMPFRLDSPWFVCVAMICFLGLAFMAGPVVRIRMPRALRTVRTWEVDGGLYRALGVPSFGRLLRRTALRLLNTDVYLDAGTRDLVRVRARLEAAEASHFWAAALVVPYLAYVSLMAMWSALLGVSFVQVLVNVYPVMHLRLSRHRLDRLSSRRSSMRDRASAAPGSAGGLSPRAQ
jgi:hypothetical protein